MKKFCSILLMALVTGAMLWVDMAEAARRIATRPRAAAPAKTTPAPAATQPTAPSTAATAPAASATPAAAAPSAMQPAGQYAAPGQFAAPVQQGSGMGGALLGAGAGLLGGYMLGNALAPDTANAAQPDAAQPAGGASSAPAAAPAGPGSLLSFDTATYCTQYAQGNAAVQQQCLAAEEKAMATLRGCVGMSTGLNNMGSYDVLLRCLRSTPAAQ